MAIGTASRTPRGALLFALGIGAGLAVGMLFGPKSGKETRKALSESGQKGAEYLSQQGRHLAASTGEIAANVKDFWLAHREEIQTFISLGERFYKEVMQPMSRARAGNAG